MTPAHRRDRTRPARLDTLLRIATALDCELVVELRPRTRPSAVVR